MMNKTAIGLLAVTLAVSCLLILNPVFATTGDSWASKAPMPTARAHLRVAVVNDIIYAIGGGGPAGTNEAYNPATNNWTTKASMPDPPASFSIAACQGKIYCIGGMPSGFSGASNLTIAYNPSADSWETKAGMPTARYNPQAQEVNGKIYVIGGNRILGYDLGSEPLNATEIYDPVTDTWSMGSPIPMMDGCVSAVVDGKIYVIGQTTQIYDPKTDSWSTGASPLYKDLSTDGSAAAATTGLMAPKRIYVCNGSAMQVYDPRANNWTLCSPPPTVRQSFGIGAVNDRLYFIGGMYWPIPDFGIYYIFDNTNEEYTPLGYGSMASESQSGLLPLWLILSVLTAIAVLTGAVIYLKKRK